KKDEDVPRVPGQTSPIVEQDPGKTGSEAIGKSRDDDDDPDDDDDDEPDEDDYGTRAGKERDEYDDGMRDGDDLTASDRHKMAAASFAVPESEGLPINNPGHVRAAMARFGQFEFKSSEQKHAAYNRVMRRAKQFGINAEGFEKAWQHKLDHTDEDTAMSMKEL